MTFAYLFSVFGYVKSKLQIFSRTGESLNDPTTLLILNVPLSRVDPILAFLPLCFVCLSVCLGCLRQSQLRHLLFDSCLSFHVDVPVHFSALRSYFYVCVCVCASVWMHVIYMWMPGETRRSCQAPRAGVTGGYEPPDTDSGTWTQVPKRSSKCP